MDDQVFDQRLSAWLRDGRTAASGWVLESAVGHARAHPRQAPMRGRWSDAIRATMLPRRAPMAYRFVVIVAALAVLLSLASAGYLAWRQNEIVPPIPVPSATASPATPGTPAPSELPTASSIAPPTDSPSIEPTPMASVPVAAYACPPGSNPDGAGARDQDRPGDLMAPLAFDPANGRLITVGRGSLPPWSIWTFDVCTNTWHETNISLEHAPLLLVYDTRTSVVRTGAAQAGDRLVNGEIVYAASERAAMAEYDLETGDVRATASIPFDPSQTNPFGGVYRSATGQLVVRETKGLRASALWAYDASSDTWIELEQKGEVPTAAGTEVVSYDPSRDRLVMYSNYYPMIDPLVQQAVEPANWTFEYDFASSTWTKFDPPASPECCAMSLQMAWDQTQARTVALFDGRLTTYDAGTHEWSALSDKPVLPQALASCTLPRLVGDPVNERIDVLCRNFEEAKSAGAIGAFDVAAPDWVTLLGPESQ